METNVARGRGRSRGRGRRSFYRNTGENDPYDMSIAPLNLFENQVIPISLHNLSKSFLGQINPPFEFYREVQNLYLNGNLKKERTRLKTSTIL